MKILWLSWKDEEHPEAGGAEVISSELRKRLVLAGHEVKLITSRPTALAPTASQNGVEVFRTGNRYSVYLQAWRFYRKNLKNWPDVVIDEMNTIPFFGFCYRSKKSVLLAYQLARQVWFYQFFFPLHYFGFALEALYLRLISKRYSFVLTESESTKSDMQRFGFRASDVGVFRVGMHLSPLKQPRKQIPNNQVLFLGSVRPMKQTLHAIRAFECAARDDDKLVLNIVGDYTGDYGQKAFKYVQESDYADRITFHGKVDAKTKASIVQSASVILITSVKEGWGLIATEAASQGVPAIAYNTDGLRDSVVDGVSGILVPSGDVERMGAEINALLKNPKKLSKMSLAAIENSRQYTFENCYKDFSQFLQKIV